MNPILRIGEFSKINHISIQTLRFYDQIGLLTPHWIDPDSSYRYYHINQSSLVDAIQYLRQLDFSLEEIKEILSDKDNFHLHQLIEQRYQNLLQERDILSQRIEELEHFRSGALLYQEKQRQQDLEILTFPQRKLLVYEIDNNIYQMSSEEYEVHLRRFKSEILSYHPFFSHFSRVGSLMKKSDFQQSNWQSSKLILFQQEEIPLPNMKTATLTQGNYAVSYCPSFEEEIQQLSHFRQTLTQAGYHIAGDYICEVIHEQPQLDQNQRDMFIRMQVKVEEG
ncbi:MerR family transcriptional regulator [Streptococcus panodentis]|uniref:MerR family transcriptional regulator n=1 Tax=Streptococcus panodentis TaxID=1581472 RepID=A0ABS5B0C0_9STRE|nr:helix-turn-helix domain-containing protein [Streptococcus panodentis]MBP2622274.1 MerR family transcriptional regulator [Streptococcus panodentis]